MENFDWATEGREIVRLFEDQVRGRTFLITGPSQNSIGAETVLSLANGHPGLLVLVGRSQARVQPVIDAVHAIDASLRVKFVEADLASMASVRKAAQQIVEDDEIARIDVVINNAGIMACPYEKSVDGFELQLAANHLGHFLLTNLIMPKVLPTANKEGRNSGSRVVVVASSGNKYAGMRWTDPNFAEPGSYSPFGAYGQSKTANVLFAVGLNRRLGAGGRQGAGFMAYALHPGSVATGLQVHMTPDVAADATAKILGTDPATGAPLARPPLKTLQQGCATTLRAALDPDLPAQSGVWLNDCRLTDDKDPVGMVAPWALDSVDAERCWTLSEELLGQKFEY